MDKTTAIKDLVDKAFALGYSAAQPTSEAWAEYLKLKSRNLTVQEANAIDSIKVFCDCGKGDMCPLTQGETLAQGEIDHD